MRCQHARLSAATFGRARASLAQEAYLRLWRRWRWISGPQAAPLYLPSQDRPGIRPGGANLHLPEP